MTILELTKNEAIKAHTEKFAYGVGYDEGNLRHQIINIGEQNEIAFLKSLKENDLFKQIGVVYAKQEQGEAIGLLQVMGGTTDTNYNSRRPKTGTNRGEYHCEQVNFDSYVNFEKIDAYAGSTESDFLEAHEAYLNKHFLKSILMVGFNGVERARDSNPEKYPLAQDVKKGWLQKIRENAQTNNLKNVINVGEINAVGHFTSLNKAVKEGLKRINPIYTDGDLVAICGRDVIGETPLSNEENELQGKFITRLTKPIAGVKAIYLPYFPDDCILLTRLENLAFYFKRNSLRRGYIDEPAKDLLSHYFSLSLDFVVENFNACALLENIELEA